MPNPVQTNPAFANNPPGVLMAPQSDDYWALDPNISIATLSPTVAHLATNLAAPQPGVGLVVEIQSWNGLTSGASGSPTHPTVALSATTADGSIVGVISGAQVAGSGVSVPGQVVQVRRFGITPVIVDNTVTAGHALVQSTGTAGAAHDSGGVGGTQGETIGIALEAVTVSSGLGLTLMLVKLT
jgi:hypothetical protein